jgi:hypothetical protein
MKYRCYLLFKFFVRCSACAAAVATLRGAMIYVGITQASTGFYRSNDGITWETIAGTTGPRLVDLAFGWGEKSANCPM